MKQATIAFLAVAGLMALVVPVAACPTTYSSFSYGYGNYYSPSYSSYVAPYVKTITVPVAVYQPLAVLVPTYTAGYLAPATAAPAANVTAPAAQAMPSCTEEIKALKLQLEQLRQQLSTPPPAKMPPADPFNPQPVRSGLNDVGAVFGTYCGSCHEAKAATEKGGGFKLIEDGKLTQLTERQVRKIATQTAVRKMPKDSKLTDSEIALIQQWADGVK